MKKKPFSLILIIAILLSMLSALSATVYADGNPYNPYAVDKDGNWANCTYWAWQSAYDAGYHLPEYSWGNAGSWYESAQADGYYCDNNPSANSIAVYKGGIYGYGHVQYVVSVSENQMYVIEGGVAGTSNGRRERWTSVDSVYGYIHLGELPDPPGFVITASTVGNTVDLYWTNVYASNYHIQTYRYESNAVTYEADTGQISKSHLELASGTYTVYITADSGDGYPKTASVDFSLPSQDGYTVSVNTAENTAGFSWQSIGAGSYWVYVWNKATGAETYSASAGDRCCSFIKLQKGEYSVTVTAYMPDGSSRAAASSFVIGKEITLSVDPNEGVLNGKTDIQVYSVYSDDTVQINAPQREGYTFAGWKADGAGELLPKSLYYKYGKPLYSDTRFYESVEVYNNNNNGAVTHTLMDADDGCPSVSGKMIMIKTVGQALPAFGGFMQYTKSSAKNVYYHVFTAKIPLGFSLNHAGNSIGYQGTREWITDNKGTGEWKTYIYRVKCGFVGDFHTFGHVYISADENGTDTVTWYLCASNIYDGSEIINGLNTDPCFTVGQPLIAYNNLSNGNVSLNRIENNDPDCPSASGYYLQVKTSGTASPELGGVYFPVDSIPDGVFYQVIVAKIPVGYEIERASNACGDGYTAEWLTDNKGTGNWETYICKTICGKTGTFGTLGHWYIKALDGQKNVTWYVCYANYFDSTPVFCVGDGNAVLTAQWESLEYKTGDINGDGSVNNKDVVILFKYVSSIGISVNTRVLDFNGDGNVNNKDVAALFKYVSS